ncbi:MAG: DoxX family protein [Planctomycetota bacterium]|nr:DoxX family protein [Planctomycetota bacterium]
MDKLAVVAQVVIAVSVLYVWVFRYDNIVKEFREYGLSDLFRSMVGAAKIALSTLLLAGIWYPQLVLVPALAMAALMAGAQASHFKVRHPFPAFVPSLVLLLLSLFVAAVRAGLIA